MQSTLGEYQETQSQEAFALQNSKLLKVSLDQVTIQAKLGSMVAYQGDVSFEHAGSGYVALVSDGPPVLLDVGSAPTFADPQAAITWSSGVRTGLKTDIKLKNFIGRSSGESIQMSFSGPGWVLVQPSEGRVAAATPSGGGAGGLLGNLTG